MKSFQFVSLVEGGEGLYLHNCQTNLVIALYTLSLLLCNLIITTAYHLGRYELSSHVSCLAPRLTIAINISIDFEGAERDIFQKA